MVPPVSAFAQLPACYKPDPGANSSRTQPSLPYFLVLEILPVQRYLRIDHLVHAVSPELHQDLAHLYPGSSFWSEIHLL